jgi:hypothetical protein
MNKKHRSKKVILMLCLVVALFTSQVFQPMDASATDEVTVTATNFTQLYTALKNAEDGDVIAITGGLIDIYAEETFGYTDKHITIKRLDSSAKFRIQSPSLSFQNITFDGNGIDAGTAFILSNGTVAFQDCVFQDCITTTANGGAVYVMNQTPTFENCTFDSNTGVQGGHMYVAGGTVTIRNCTFTNGHALSDGGAIKNLSAYPKGTYIYSSTITGNSADKYGGGLSLEKYVYVEDTKIYDNTATGGGADIARFGLDAQLSMIDSSDLEGLLELYQDEEFVPTGWVNDYDAESGVEFPSGNLTSPNVLMKLDYFYPPTEVVLDEASLGTADNGKVTGLESGKYYKVTAGEVVSYSKADGTLTTDEAEASPLDGTEITGLTNGETYLVEEFTPAPTTVLLDSTSLGIADNEKITGLSAGKYYKVSMDATISYTKTDGTLTTIEAEAEALTGTEIVGLTNGETYLVEEYTPPTPEPEPEEPIEEPGDDIDPIEEPDPSEEPIEEPNPNDDQDEEPIEEPTPDPDPIDDDQEEETTPTPKPSPKPNSGSGGSSYSSYPVVTAPKAVVLSSGKAVIDTTKTEYLLGYSDGLLGNQNTVTRSQFAQIVYRLLTADSLEDVYSEKNTFKDVVYANLKTGQRAHRKLGQYQYN